MVKDKKYYESLDKRTKEYKSYAKFNKITNEPKGLGDVVEGILNSKLIKPITEVIKKSIWKDGEDCGCKDRVIMLNKLPVKFAQKRKPKRCLTESQYNNYQKYRDTRTLNVWVDEEISLLVEIYAHVFAIKYQQTDLCRNCSGSEKLLFNMSKELDIIFETYKRDLQDLKIK